MMLLTRLKYLTVKWFNQNNPCLLAMAAAAVAPVFDAPVTENTYVYR